MNGMEWKRKKRMNETGLWMKEKRKGGQAGETKKVNKWKKRKIGSMTVCIDDRKKQRRMEKKEYMNEYNKKWKKRTFICTQWMEIVLF